MKCVDLEVLEVSMVYFWKYIADRSFIGFKLVMKPFVCHIEEMGTRQLPIHVYGCE